MSHVIAIAMHAGGVGKTTTALNLGYSLAARERRVLLVDLDPQADLTDRARIGARCRRESGGQCGNGCIGSMTPWRGR